MILRSKKNFPAAPQRAKTMRVTSEAPAVAGGGGVAQVLRGSRGCSPYRCTAFTRLAWQSG